MKSKGGTASLKCRRLFYWRAPEMVGSVFLCPQQICPPAANVPAVTNLCSLYHPQSTYICNRRPPSSHLFFSFVVRVQKCQICHIIWMRWRDKYWWKWDLWKAFSSDERLLGQCCDWFFSLQINEYPVQLSFSRCEFTGWRVSNGRRATTTPNVKSNNKLCTLALLVSAVRSLQCGES